MCETIDHRRESTKQSIVVEFERDPSLRATEIIVINKDRKGNDKQAVKLIASDSGNFMAVGKATDLIDGVDLVV